MVRIIQSRRVWGAQVTQWSDLPDAGTSMESLVAYLETCRQFKKPVKLVPDAFTESPIAPNIWWAAEGNTSFQFRFIWFVSIDPTAQSKRPSATEPALDDGRTRIFNLKED